MSRAPLSEPELASAHRHFSADCFNRTWDLFERPDRTPGDDEAMILSAAASLWHWTQRADRTDLNLSVGHWQVSRAFALAGEGRAALRHALRSLELAAGSPPFFAGYAHEAAARAAAVLGDPQGFASHLEQGKACAAQVADPADRTTLEQDLDSLRPPQDPPV